MKNCLRTFSGAIILFLISVCSMIVYYTIELPDSFDLTRGSSLKIESMATISSTPTEKNFDVQSSSSKIMPMTEISTLKLFGVIPIKNVEVNTVEAQLLIPSGEPFGIKLTMDGVMVVGIGEVDSKESLHSSPAKDGGIQKGDIILSLNGTDIESNKERQISNESVKEINRRNTIMRDNSLDIATMVAYRESGKEITIKEKKNIVIARTLDNGLEVGDIILSVDGMSCDDVSEIKKVINRKEEGEYVTFKILRNNKEKEIKSKIVLSENTKVVGVVIITEYDYDISPKIDIKFKNSESGSSGGLMLTLTIYNAINDEDIIKNRKIAGTGTISSDGTVGEIDGVKYKIMGAAREKVDVVFVPTANYEEAVMVNNKYKYNLNIVRVDSFKETIEYLKNN